MPRFIFILFLLASNLVCADPIETNFELYEDSSIVLTFAEVQRKPFKKLDVDQLSFGYSNSAFWLKVEITQNPIKKLLLKSCYTQIDNLDVLIQLNLNWKRIETGDLRTFDSRDVHHPCFIFHLADQEIQTVYIRAKSQGSINLPIEIIEEEYFWHDNMTKQLGYGFHFAVLITMVIYNLFLFVIVQDKSYLYYVVYLGSIVLLLACMTGHAYMYLWPDFPKWANISALSFAIIANTSGLQFVKSLSNIDSFAPKSSKLINFLSLIFLGLLTVIFVNYKLASLLIFISIFISVNLFLYAIFISLKAGWKPSYFLLVGIIVLLPGIILMLGQILGWIESNWWTRNTLHIGTAVEAMLFSFALAYRIRILNEDLDTERNKTIELQSQFSRSLLQAADTECRSIARELHDGLAQSLLAIKARVGQMTESGSQEQVLLQLKQSLGEIRNLSKKMHPQQLDTLGLATAIESVFKQTLEPIGVDHKLKLEDVSGLLDKDTELHIFRIAQEALNNIVKHADASFVSVLLTIKDNLLKLVVEDNGIGITVAESSGMGILNMKERATLIYADFEIVNQKEGGTRVELAINQNSHHR